MTAPMDDVLATPHITAAVSLIGRTGAADFQIRYHDDEQPVVWLAVAVYPDGRAEAAGAISLDRAVMRLLEQLIDGGQCVHCGRLTGVDVSLGDLPLEDYLCWYQFDPELVTFRRGCEGSDA